jgi:hypothetical protein
MVWVYAIALAVGFLLLLGWIVGVALAAWVEGWEWADPERRFGGNGRWFVAGVFGFGMAGMSATFAGWHPILSLIAAGLGAAALMLVARAFAPAEA